MEITSPTQASRYTPLRTETDRTACADRQPGVPAEGYVHMASVAMSLCMAR
ncbi:MAG: hypothetical protein Ct9H300mP16_06090 [Pseudomonadota bacterium]|nr:MAG: hypothetical protein Ct9H300mP16_06090 [Pseudomonadota bacterium]